MGERYEVPVAALAAEAYPMIVERMPDAVVLDIRMETPDAGLRVLERLRLDPPGRAVSVVVCTADSHLLEKETPLRALDCTILAKPFLIEELLNALVAVGCPSARSGDWRDAIGQQRMPYPEDHPSDAVAHATGIAAPRGLS